MPRARTGLGHGLEALVSARDEVTLNSKNQPPAPGIAEVSAPARSPSWAYATLERQRPRKRKLVFAASHGCAGGIEQTSVRGVGLLAALNALGTDGWELTAIYGKKLYLKRQKTP